jgi:hypothetical protein
MSMFTWHVLQAEKCERLAATSTDVLGRVRHEAEAKLWRWLAEDDLAVARQSQSRAP